MTESDAEKIAAERRRVTDLVGRLIAEAWLRAHALSEKESPQSALAPGAEAG